LLEALKAEGVEIDPHRQYYEYGRFAWVTDPGRNRIELWEAPKSSQGSDIVELLLCGSYTDRPS